MNKTTGWIILGYLACLLAGIPGIIAGALILNARKKTSNGNVMPVFDARARKHAKIIIYAGSVILIISILFAMNWIFLEKILFGDAGGN